MSYWNALRPEAVFNCPPPTAARLPETTFSFVVHCPQSPAAATGMTAAKTAAAAAAITDHGAIRRRDMLSDETEKFDLTVLLLAF